MTSLHSIEILGTSCAEVLIPVFESQIRIFDLGAEKIADLVPTSATSKADFYQNSSVNSLSEDLFRHAISLEVFKCLSKRELTELFCKNLPNPEKLVELAVKAENLQVLNEFLQKCKIPCTFFDLIIEMPEINAWLTCD